MVAEHIRNWRSGRPSPTMLILVECENKTGRRGRRPLRFHNGLDGNCRGGRPRRPTSPQAMKTGGRLPPLRFHNGLDGDCRGGVLSPPEWVAHTKKGRARRPSPTMLSLVGSENKTGRRGRRPLRGHNGPSSLPLEGKVAERQRGRMRWSQSTFAIGGRGGPPLRC